MNDVIINYWAVLVAGVANMAVGFLWYGPLFGRTWKGLMGFTDESIKSMKMTPAMSMAGGFIVSLIMAYVLAIFISIFGVWDIKSALYLTCWIWLGFLATNTIGSYLWEGKPFKLFLLNSIEQFVAVNIMAVILVMWQ